jgi:hypothetical protein
MSLEPNHSDFYLRAMGFQKIEEAIDQLLVGYVPLSEPLLPPEPQDPLAVPAGSCPKCIAVRPEALEACPSCGLEYARFHASQVAPSAEVLEGFNALQAEEFGAPVASHVKLLTRSHVLGELPHLIRLYRIIAVRNPKDTIAPAVLAEAVKIVSVVLELPATEPESRRAQAMRNLLLFMLGNAFLAAIAARTLASF